MKKFTQKLRLVCLAILFASVGKAQMITTVAGTGTAGSTGNGGQATSAKLNGPAAVDFDAAGNLYIADQTNNMIRKITSAGVISTLAGTGTAGFSGDGGQATAAKLDAPTGVTLDAIGNVYVADQYTYRIRKISTSGVITTVAGNGSATFAGDGGQATAASLFNPTCVAFDAVGNMYIGDYSNNRIRKVNSSGIISTVVGNGTAGFSGDGGQATAAKLNGAVGVAFDGAGNMFIADRNNNRIRKVTTAGVISTMTGNGTAGSTGDGGQATSAELSGPFGIGLDSYENLYIADAGNNKVRRVNSSGIITTIAGTGTAGYSGDGGYATAAELDFPAEISLGIDGNDNLYIADYGNNRVREVTYSTTFFFKTIASGNYSSASIWQASPDNSTNWATVLVAPDYQSSGIVISSGDSVVFNSTDTLDQVTVNGILTYGTGCTLNLNNGTGVDLAISNNAKFYDNGDNSIVWNSATWTLGSSAYMIRTRSTSSDNFRTQYNGGISTIPASSNWIVRKTGTDNPSIATNSMYYGNLNIENNTGTTWTTSTASSFTGTAGYPTIQGNMSIGGNGTGNVSFLDTNTNAQAMIVQGNFTVTTGSTFRNHGTGCQVQGNLVLNGTVNYTSSGMFSFNGSNNQTINGTSITFNNIKLNKASAAATVTLNAPVSVAGTFTFTNGTLVTDTVHLLTFNAGSSQTGVNDSSFVSGPVKKIGNTAFTFPVGKGSNAQTIGIAAPTYTTDAFQAEYFNTDPTAIYGSTPASTFNYVSTCQYFNLKRKNGTSNVLVTLSYDLTSCIINMIPDPRVTVFNGTLWADLGESNFMYSNFGGTISTATTVTQYGIITLGNNSTTPFNPLDTTFQLETAGPCGAIYMSEYVQDTLGNTAIEIYNPTADTINLSNYYISTTKNSSITNPTLQYALSGKIAPYKTFVAVNSGAPSSVLLSKANQLFKNFYFNGKDAISLEYSTNIGIIIDKIGDYNIPYTDSGWVVSAFGDTGTTKNHDLARLITVTGGNVEWATAQYEWYSHPMGTYSYLGWHTGICAGVDSLPTANMVSSTYSTSLAPFIASGYSPNDDNVTMSIKLVGGSGGTSTPGWQSPIVVYYNDYNQYGYYGLTGDNSPHCKTPQADYNDWSYSSTNYVVFPPSSTGSTPNQTFIIDVSATSAAGDININGATITGQVGPNYVWGCFFVDYNPAYAGPPFQPYNIGTNYESDLYISNLPLDVGIQTLFDNKQIKVYPNPFNNQITIVNTSQTAITKVSVCDLLGREVISLTPNQISTITVNTQGFDDGVYFIKVYNNSDSFTVKLIKE